MALPQCERQAMIQEAIQTLRRGCSGVSLSATATSNSNNVMADGEAEYYAQKQIGAAITGAVAGSFSGVSAISWTTKYDGTAGWATAISEFNTQLAKSDCGGSCAAALCSGTKCNGKTDQASPWTNNAVGNAAFDYIFASSGGFRPATTHKEIMQMWIDSGTSGSGPAFNKLFCKKYSEFIAQFRTKHNSCGSGTTCAAVSANNRAWVNPCSSRRGSGCASTPTWGCTKLTAVSGCTCASCDAATCSASGAGHVETSFKTMALGIALAVFAMRRQ